MTQSNMAAASAAVTVTIHFAVSDGEPSTCYPEDEQAVNGAMDYDVTLTISGPSGDKIVEGGITLYPDRADGGTMGPCGSPLDGWVSSELLHGVRLYGDMILGHKVQSQIWAVLACGPVANGDEITVEARS